MQNHIKVMFSDERGNASSKRFVGVLSALLLCFAFVYSIFVNTPIYLSDTLIETIALLSFGCLGLSSVDKWSDRRSSKNRSKELSEDS